MWLWSVKGSYGSGDLDLWNAGKRVQRSSWGLQWKTQGKSPANIKIDGGNSIIYKNFVLIFHIRKHSYMLIDVRAAGGGKRENAV